SIVATPMQRQGSPVGAIVATRQDRRPYTAAEIKLVETFADQAVIAIENARLFDELQAKTREQAETLEEQAATNHILEIISQSPTDIQPVLDAIIESAARVVGSYDASLRLVENDQLVLRAHVGPITVGRATVPLGNSENQWVREHGTLHIPDALAQDEFPALRDSSSGSRTFLIVPLRQQERFCGEIVLRRLEPNPFTDRQIRL